jgi:hypothetical protein
MKGIVRNDRLYRFVFEETKQENTVKEAFFEEEHYIDFREYDVFTGCKSTCGEYTYIVEKVTYIADIIAAQLDSPYPCVFDNLNTGLK